MFSDVVLDFSFSRDFSPYRTDKEQRNNDVRAVLQSCSLVHISISVVLIIFYFKAWQVGTRLAETLSRDARVQPPLRGTPGVHACALSASRAVPTRESRARARTLLATVRSPGVPRLKILFE
jgi:hypothetical protein